MIVVVAVTGCGTAKLTLTEQDHVATYEQAFYSTASNGGEYTRTLHGIEYMITLCRHKPAASYVDKTVKQHVEDDANLLRESNPDLAAKLDRVLDDGCK